MKELPVILLWLLCLTSLSANATDSLDTQYKTFPWDNFRHTTVAHLLQALRSSTGQHWKFYSWKQTQPQLASLLLLLPLSDKEDLQLQLQVQPPEDRALLFWQTNHIMQAQIFSIQRASVAAIKEHTANDFRCLLTVIEHLQKNSELHQCFIVPIHTIEHPDMLDPAMLEGVRQACRKIQSIQK